VRICVVSLTLLYHAVLALPPGGDPDRLTLTVAPEELDWQLGELRRRGLRSLRLDELYAAAEGGTDPPDTVLLTFDDAYAHVLTAVTPLLERHGLTAALFVPAGNIGGSNDWDSEPLPVAGLPVAAADELQAAARGPWELASHGYRHVDLRGLPHAAAVEELALARAAISELAGRDVLDLAYPFGLYDEKVMSAAREAGYRMAFAAGAVSEPGRYALPRRLIRGQESRTAFRIKIDAEYGRLFY
jgi:peptidoglycan/xylan/chitin deacetylase (PgdA/CDA1 family)